MNYRVFGLILVGFFVFSNSALAAMSSTNYQILWDAVDSGGSDTSSSASYILRDSVGNPAAGSSSSTNYSDQAGYRSGIFDQFLSFDLFTQDISTGVTATNLVSNTVSANNSGFSIGDYIAIVQDPGASQRTKIGKIISLGSGTITVDNWKTPLPFTRIIDGSNDYVYKLTGTSAAFGTFSASSVSTSVIGFEVTIDNDSGYTVQVLEDGELRSGSDTINEVSDGSVTAGNEEYGARSSDSSLTNSTFDTVDTAITLSFQDIATESTLQFNSRNFLTLKTAIASDTLPGSYAQVLTFIASGNF